MFTCGNYDGNILRGSSNSTKFLIGRPSLPVLGDAINK